jgi:hypothetical protein
MIRARESLLNDEDTDFGGVMKRRRELWDGGEAGKSVRSMLEPGPRSMAESSERRPRRRLLMAPDLLDIFHGEGVALEQEVTWVAYRLGPPLEDVRATAAPAAKPYGAG